MTGKIIKYPVHIGTRISRVEKGELQLIASKAGLHYSDLLRDCVKCLIKHKDCKVRKTHQI